MKNKKLRYSIIAAVTAISVGVVLFGVSVAIGVAPGYTPPGSGVNPVFSALEVTGDIDSGGQLFVDDIRMTEGVNSYIWNDGGDEVRIYENLRVYHTNPAWGNLSTSGDISTAPTGTISGGTITASGNVSGASVTSTGGMTSSGDINTNGNILMNTAGKYIYNPADYVRLYYDLWIADDLILDSANSAIFNEAATTVTIADGLSVSGTINATDWISSNTSINSWGDIYAWNNLAVGGNISVDGGVQVDGNLNITGSLGRFYEKYNSWSGSSLSCDSSSHTLVDCGASARSGSSLTHAYAYGNTCYAGSSASTLVYIRIKCFDPDGV